MTSKFGRLAVFAVVVVGAAYVNSNSHQPAAPDARSLEMNSPANLERAARIIRAYGFVCLRATAIRDTWYGGTNVACDGKYNFSLEDRGGNLHVEVRGWY